MLYRKITPKIMNINNELNINEKLVSYLNYFDSENTQFIYINSLINKLSPDTDNDFFSAYRLYVNDLPKLKLETFIEYLSENFDLHDLVDNTVGYVTVKETDLEIFEKDEYQEDNNVLTYLHRFIYNKNKPNKMIKISTDVTDDKDKTEYICKYQQIFLYNFTQEEYFTIIKYFERFISQKISKVKEPKINLILQNNNGFFSRKFDIKNLKVNLDLYYGENFVKDVHKPLIKSLADNNNGLYLIHGYKGTGKTSYLRYLTTIINKDFYLVTKEFVPLLADPSCLHFIINECANSIIIIEDAEEIIKPRSQNHSGNATSLILNMGDGMLSDVVNCKFILTFNNDIDNIDDAITRPGRLKFQHQFQKLNSTYANKVAKYLKLKNVSYKDGEQVPLSDIFNYKDISNINDISTNKKTTIGFKTHK